MMNDVQRSSEETHKDLRPEMHPEAVIPAWSAMGVGLAEGSLRTAFGLIDDVRVEARVFADALLELADAAGQGALRLGRRVVDRTDALGGEALARGERAAHSLVHALRGPTREVSAVAGRTATKPSA